MRRRVLLSGKIVYPHNSLTADCTIRDLSEGGARIVINPEAISADPFLIVVSRAVVHPSATVWHTERQAGLRFSGSFDLSGETPFQLQGVRRLWVALARR
jgi:hypothetical protein